MIRTVAFITLRIVETAGVGDPRRDGNIDGPDIARVAGAVRGLRTTERDRDAGKGSGTSGLAEGPGGQ